MYIIELRDLNDLFAVLRERGYKVVAPTLRDGTIVIDSVGGVEDLPAGWRDVQSAASYSVERRSDDALFGYVVGPHSWKKYLFPARLRLFSTVKAGKGFEVLPAGETTSEKLAFIGVRPCELQAMSLQEKVFGSDRYADPYYTSVQRETFIVSVNCIYPGGNCFCRSMNTGPRATDGFDLSMTEVLGEGVHYFVVDAGTSLGESVLNLVPHRPATSAEVQRAEDALEAAAEKMGKTLDTVNLPQLLADNFEHPHWDDVAKRCLSCANCTMVCPTCFCSTVEDVTDLTGEHADRWRRWDSCFTTDFSKVAGGNIRMSTRTRYRQWLTHKLSTWVQQFGDFGCVGCGRCITWCPVGIDITEEARAIRETSAAHAGE